MVRQRHIRALEFRSNAQRLALLGAFVLWLGVVAGCARPASESVDTRPRKLSEYGLFEGNGSTQQPVAGVIPYDLNSPLFTDYAEKFRFVKLPAGESAKYEATEAFDFPVGTVIAKTFGYPVDAPRSEAGTPIAGNAHPQARARRLGGLAVYLERRTDRGHAGSCRRVRGRGLDRCRGHGADQQLHHSQRQPVQGLPQAGGLDAAAGAQGAASES